jgi:hypothetical protein
VNKAKVNYGVDVAIGLAGVISAVSGLVFLLPGDVTAGILGLSYQAWNSVHTWSSLALLAGVGAHLVLHWKWMVSMTGRMLSPGRSESVEEPARALAYGETAGRGVSRRAFLVLGGATAMVTGLVLAGRKVLSDSGVADTVQSRSLSAAAASGGSVACPRGLVNDPYPGQCRYYVDSDGDGICDYSVAGSGSTLSMGGAVGGGFPGGHGGFGRP